MALSRPSSKLCGPMFHPKFTFSSVHPRHTSAPAFPSKPRSPGAISSLRVLNRGRTSDVFRSVHCESWPSKISFTAAESPLCLCLACFLHCPHRRCRGQGRVAKATALLTTLRFCSTALGPRCLSPRSEPNHPEHPHPHPHRLCPQSWCLVRLPHFNLMKVDL